MHVLIADKLPSSSVTELVAAGLQVTIEPDLKGDPLEEALVRTGADVLVVRSTRVYAEALQASRLGLVVRAGAGFNTIDVAAASAAGIYVANCPGKNSLAVAELAIGLLVCLDRRIPDAVAELRAGRWNKREFSRARGLAGRTLGVVGAGRIGLAVAERAISLGMKVLTWNFEPSVKEEVEALGARFEPRLLPMLGLCDAVTLHVASNAQTRHLAGGAFFAAMKQGAFFINTSRADLVDERALREAVTTRGIRAGLDVFDDEVAGGEGTIDSATLRLPAVVATPHIGASTEQAQEAVASEAVRVVLAYAETGQVPNVVNVQKASPASHLLVVRHLNHVGVLSHVFAALKDANINAEQTENIVFAGAQACIARIAIDAEPQRDVLDRIVAGNPDILGVKLVPLETP